MSFWGYRPYVPSPKRRAQAAKEVDKLKEEGPRHLACRHRGPQDRQSFWGKAWCDNLERYSDFANRLPRGRTYVRNGSVIDLQIARGKVGRWSAAPRSTKSRSISRWLRRSDGRRSARTAPAPSVRWSNC